jgi:multidrug efflux pump subunit AcrA (membrane-fusion protein)
MKRLLFRLLPLFAATLVARGQDIQGLVLPFKSVSIASPVLQEVIAKVLVEEGNVVKEGDVLVELRNEKEVLEVRQYEQLVKQRKFTAEGAMKLFNEKIGSKEAAGKKLDFLSQEMIREINTMGSKSRSAAIRTLVVELKTEVERIREQVQNVE